MDQESKINMLDHSAAKVKLLKEYMAAYLGILSNTDWIREVYLYDVFCGPGLYENDGEGSPIIFLKEIKKAWETVGQPRNKLTKFKCLFNDKDVEKVEKLKSNVTKLGLNLTSIGSIEYRNDDYKVVIQDVQSEMARFKNERGFVFIDPYGYNQVNLADIKKLTSTGKAEILLFLPTHHMYRFKDNGTPECLMEFMTDLKITSKIRNVSGLEFIDVVMNGFQKELGNDIYVDSFVIKRELNQFFCLFFFSSNMLGYLKMLEAKWKIDQEDGRGWAGISDYNLFSQTPISPNTQKLKELLVDFLKSGPRTNGEVFEFIIRKRFLPKHGKEILQSLEGLEVTNETGQKVPKGAFYLTQKDFKDSPNKISIRLK